MTSLLRTALFVFPALLWMAAPAFAERESNSFDKEGAFILSFQEFPGCRAEQVKLKYRLETVDGKPKATAWFQWQAAPDSKPDCLPKDMKVALEFFSRTRLVKHINFQPEILKSGAGYGKPDSATRSWDKLLCGWGRDDVNDCMTEEQAKEFIESGYKITGFQFWR